MAMSENTVSYTTNPTEPLNIVQVGGDTLDEYAMQHVLELNPTEVRYHYEDGGYDGRGATLLKVSDLWYYHDMGHCSCNGPTEYMSLREGYSSLEELLLSCSEELRNELLPLIP